ncbi:SLIT-ROBO Rho GTPase-activating protein 1-like isoform X2 [Neocloeon triangulifer]|uniref:SLIT-ROBO Rho GTPase-activating protein 1-like isoform X2 n=1 Tax=Neocloeon triangulifer TaxID=2078957 RepID=UPI00286ECBA6|nr:SLIT-ROBO Rho GTPase-activating protein 1-like isoform X2 [Neocloeon triangulifer]
MFQCIIQQRNGWIKGSPEMRDVFPDIRLQLAEQLRCLDTRMESQVSLVAELQDYFRRRAEVELDYSKNLEKLSKSLALRHREQKQKREQWPLFSSFSCWQQLQTHTKGLSKDHAALSEIYSVHLVGRLAGLMDDVQRIYRRCREIGYETHEELLRVLHELHTTSKTWLSYQAEARQAEGKLRLAEAQRVKLENSIPKEKRERSKKYRVIEKEVLKRKNKFNDARLKALKARNEYVLCLEASNTTVHKYFVDDLSDLIDCMDLGFHHCISGAMMAHVAAEEGRQQSVQAGLDQMAATVAALDSRLDKQRFLESNHTAFMIPKKFEVQGTRTEEEVVMDVNITMSLKDELESRLCQLQNRITSLRTESEEVWKTMETAERSLLDMLTAKDFDVNQFFKTDNATPPNASLSSTLGLAPQTPSHTKAPETLSIKLKQDKQETEEFYLGKFREYLLGTSRIARLHAKHDYIRKTLLAGSSDLPPASRGTQIPNNGLTVTGDKPIRRKRIGRLQMIGQPKLFGGSLEEYLESTNQEIPLVMKSCIRVINLYGLHHQGIFRVSGSQVEINNFKDSFERGEDPLADVTDASDINSVAGVLKLYLRELREPLLPIIYFDQLMELAQLKPNEDFVGKMKELLQSLPRTVVIVMRYLFAFLKHLSEYSEENMMDPYNLAICFGPTLVPVPDDKDQVQYQNLINELIKNVIEMHDELFQDDGGPTYEKYISCEPDETDMGDSPSDNVHDDIDSEVYPSEDECESLEATVQFDFRARSKRELSLRKGQHVTLYNQVSNDWWRGSAGGHEGLIPDKYIMLKINKDDDRERLELKSSSDESVVKRRASSSNDSLLSGQSSQHSPIEPVVVEFEPIDSPGPPTLPPPCTVTPVNLLPSLNRNSIELALAQLPPEDNTPAENVSVKVNGSHAAPEIQLDGLSGTNWNNVTEKTSLEDSELHESQAEPHTLQQTDELHIEADRTSLSSLSSEGSTGSSTGSTTSSTFQQSREIWRKRENSASESTPVLPTPHLVGLPLRQKHTPDLVMDLPLNSSTSISPSGASDEDAEASPSHSPQHSGPESPDMTAAERFAKQNQCTLKKKDVRTSSSSSSGSASVAIDAQTQTKVGAEKPPLKAKPQIMKKPGVPPASPDLNKNRETN